MKKLQSLLIILFGFIFISCDDENEQVTVTVTAPNTYSLKEMDKLLSVQNGQSSRLEMAGELVFG